MTSASFRPLSRAKVKGLMRNSPSSSAERIWLSSLETRRGLQARAFSSSASRSSSSCSLTVAAMGASRICWTIPSGGRRRDGPKRYLGFSPSRKAIASSSTRTASMTGTTGRAWNSKAGSIEQNL